MIRLLLLLSFYFLSYSQNSNVDITIYKKSILTIIDSKSTIEVLADGFKVAEGPLWDSKNERLLFSDVKQNKIFTWDSIHGVQDYISPSGSTGYAPKPLKSNKGSNGLAFNALGEIILCQVSDRKISSIKNNRTEKPKFKTLVDNYNGKRFNGPNDLAISKSGAIFFTDPPYGFFVNGKNEENTYREIRFNGVYKLSPNGKISVITSLMSLPNGIAISNDEKYIYINNAGKKDPKIIRFDIESSKETLFFDGKALSKKYKGAFDGLKVHSSGNIFTTGPNGILIISPSGDLLATINYGKGVTNCNFDTNEEYLYVTGFNDISRIKLK